MPDHDWRVRLAARIADRQTLEVEQFPALGRAELQQQRLAQAQQPCEHQDEMCAALRGEQLGRSPFAAHVRQTGANAEQTQGRWST